MMSAGIAWGQVAMGAALGAAGMWAYFAMHGVTPGPVLHSGPTATNVDPEPSSTTAKTDRSKITCSDWLCMGQLTAATQEAMNFRAGQAAKCLVGASSQRAVMKVRVDEDGFVCDADVEENISLDADICLIRYFRGATFPPPRRGPMGRPCADARVIIYAKPDAQ